MKEAIQSLLELLRKTSVGTRMMLACAVLLIVGVAGISTFYARNPHFTLLYSGLDEASSAKVQNALAVAGVRYKVSQPPGPYFIHVDESMEYQAKNAVALSDALTPDLAGIQTDTSGVFLSAGERQQASIKREWEEMEAQLEALDFVQLSNVTTSIPRSSGLAPAPPPTVSVVLHLRDSIGLRPNQAQTVARLVQHRCHTPPENVVISDSHGETVFAGGKAMAQGSGDMLADKARSDRDTAERVNLLLAQTYGPNRAYVTVVSDWSFAQRELVTERIDPTTKSPVKQTKQKTKTPQGGSSGVGGQPGIPGGFGVDNSSVPGDAGSGKGGSDSATTENTETTNRYGVETEHVVTNAPLLERLSVALIVDTSLSEELSGLEATVMAAVGFNTTRGDVMSTHSTAFSALPRDEEGTILEPEAVPIVAPPNPIIELALERGIEIVAALFFLVVLMKTLKGMKLPTAGGTVATGQGNDEGIDTEALAQAKVEELLSSDPERVTKILSEWASREAVGADA